MKLIKKVRYLGDVFSDKADSSELCKHSDKKAKVAIVELLALSKGINSGKKKIESFSLLHKTMFWQDVSTTVRLGQD